MDSHTYSSMSAALNGAPVSATNGDSQKTTFSADGDGNLTSWSGGWSFSYNAKNQTTQLDTLGVSESYAYSGPDQQEVLSQTDSSGTLQFANSALGVTDQQGSGNDAAQTMSFQRDNRGNLVSVTYNGTQYNYFLFDGLGSVAAITDPSGVAGGGYRYDPYGNIASYSGWLSTPFTFVSGWTGVNTDVVHFGARWYAPATTFTRWTQRDPHGGSCIYAADNPVNEVDPSGEFSALGCGLAIASLVTDFSALSVSVLALLDVIQPEIGLTITAVLALIGGTLTAASVAAALPSHPQIPQLADTVAELIISLNASALSFANPLFGIANIAIDAKSIVTNC